MSLRQEERREGLRLIVEHCFRELAYVADSERVLEYGSMAAGIEKEELRRLVAAQQTACYPC